MMALLCSPVHLAGTYGQEKSGAANAHSKPTTVRDVSLDSKGQLELVVVNGTGQQVPGIVVSIAFQGKEIARAKSNVKGVVTVSGLKPGLHAVSTPYTSSVFRFLTPGQAPPSILKKVALPLQYDTTRGQYGPMMGYPMQPMMGPAMMAPGLLATGVTATAIAVVLIGKSEGDDSVVIPASP